MSDTRKQILLHLSEGEVLSGMQLAAHCGVSRAAVWKHIEALRISGVMIEVITGKGYQIRQGLSLLDEKTILELMVSTSSLTLLQQTESTNDWLMQRLDVESPSTHVCLAERQTAGRGTKGRQWVSPYGSNLYCSLYWRFELAPFELGGLSLAIAVSLAKALQKLDVPDVKIKWPNDLYTARGKLGGILIDMSAEANGPSDVVIGIGLNVGMPQGQRDSIDQAVADMFDAAGVEKDRNKIAACVIDALINGCKMFSEQGFQAFAAEWQQRDLAREQAVKLICGERVVEGIACGVNENGMLRIRTEQGTQEFASGDVSMRVQP